MEVDTYVQQQQQQQQQLSPVTLPFARSYQLEALEKAIRENTIVFLETGSGKTLIAIMLLRSYAYLLRKPSPFIAVFLVPQVVLVSQQAEAVKTHTDLKVGMYWGEMGVDYWDAATWKKETEKHEVLVMTPAILLSGLRHSFLKLNMIKVLIMDECHHARGRHPYACIMTEFYHRQLKSGSSDLTRIFGMTASPIKSKVGNSEMTFSKNIRKLMTLMHSKVYTCANEAVIAEFIPISTPKFKFYKHTQIPFVLFEEIADKLNILKQQHELSLKNSDFTTSVAELTHKRINKIDSAVMYCLDELGVWLALKAAESSSNESECVTWGNSGDTIVKKFTLGAVFTLRTYLPTGPQWSIGKNIKSDVDMGLLTSKVCCLIDSLLEYRDLNDMRCIVFVERVITAIVLQSLLRALLPKYNSWKTKFIAGNHSGLQNQTRKTQNEIVEEFRMGLVNVIVATSILEEGLDVQSCNLVIRFDPSPTVCSFIQSRGRARMQNSDYVLMVKSGDSATHSRLKKYLASGDIMRKESLRHASLPLNPLETDQFHEEYYRVESTEAIVNLSSSIGLIYFYCSRLPADGYFKPTPRWDKEAGILHLPKSCPLQKSICVQGDKKILKNIACLEACKQLHKIGALTDNLIPDIVIEEAEVEEFGKEPYNDEQPSYVPSELVNRVSKTCKTMYHCYLIALRQNFSYDMSVHDIVLAMRTEIDPEIACMQFEMCFDRGSLSVKLRYMGTIHLAPNEVLLCKRFQISILRILLDNNVNKLANALDKLCLEDNLEIDYLLLPATAMHQRPAAIDWLSIASVSSSEIICEHQDYNLRTKNGPVCTCKLRNSLVCTPHNGCIYVITDIMKLDGNSPLVLRDGGVTTYKKYFEQKHGIHLHFAHQRLLNARHIFQVKNYCQKQSQEKDRESGKTSVELPPELCCIIMSPISIRTIYSFSFIPSIMHRLESLLGALNLKQMHLDHCTQNKIPTVKVCYYCCPVKLLIIRTIYSFSFIPSIMHRLESLLGALNLKQMHLDHCTQNKIPTVKVLEAITSKRCQEPFHYESLETLGDSFLKYAASQQLFKTHQNQHEGLLSVKKEKMVSNAALCRFGCSCKLPGFIRNAPFDPKTWTVPGDKSGSFPLEELVSKRTKIYVSGKRKIKRKIVADVVEALIGAFLSTGGEKAALLFMDWVGIKVDFDIIRYERQYSVHPEKLVNVSYLESLLKYSFHDSSLLVEALTHGSYMLPEIPRCYQRLEFLGDAVLDYLITVHLYEKYPGLSPGLLTDMRAASVNNDCYAWSAIKAGLHKHVLHASQELHKHMVITIEEIKKLSSESTYGWESETSFPKVLGDVIESLAGAILVDSGYNKEVVFQSIVPLLEPLITPETLKVHPVRELNELCQKENYIMNKTVSRRSGSTYVTIEVQANGVTHKHTSKAADKKTAKKIASKEVLKSLKKSVSKQ